MARKTKVREHTRKGDVAVKQHDRTIANKKASTGSKGSPLKTNINLTSPYDILNFLKRNPNKRFTDEELSKIHNWDLEKTRRLAVNGYAQGLFESDKDGNYYDLKNNLKGNYKGFDYEIDEYGYGYKIYLPNGRVNSFQPYYGNKVFDIGDTEKRIKFTRRRVYNRINTLITK